MNAPARSALGYSEPPGDFWFLLNGMAVVAVVAMVPTLFSSVMDRGYEVAKLSLATSMALLGCATLLARRRWSLLGFADRAATLAVWSLAAFVLTAGLSTLASETPLVALFGSYYRREGLITWFVYAAFFAAVVGFAREARDRVALVDVMMLASVVPVAYAAQQRYGLDFYFDASLDPTRSRGTLGNPVFLAAYLGLCLPILAARLQASVRRPAKFGLWALVGAIQVYGLLITQSRGALLAVLAGFALLVVCSTAFSGRRFFLALTGFGLAPVVGALLVINNVSSVKTWVAPLPVLGRLIFSLTPVTDASTTAPARSAATRLAIWQVGADALAEAPLTRKLIGYGPESAYVHYFRHMPASVWRSEGGYGAANTFDRLHADTLDIGLNLGLLGWFFYCIFFCSTMYAIAKALFGLRHGRFAWMFFGSCVTGACLGAATAFVAGAGSGSIPGAGLGIALGWFAFYVCCAWGSSRAGSAAAHGLTTEYGWLLAGAAASLLVFWMDAQVNIPVLTTRLMSLFIAAIALSVIHPTARAEDPLKLRPSVVATDVRLLGGAFCLVAACASFFPVVLLDASMLPAKPDALPLRFLPILALLLVGCCGFLASRRYVASAGWRMNSAAIGFATGIPLSYALIHAALAVKVVPPVTVDILQPVALAAFVIPMLMVLSCVSGALHAAGLRDALRAVQTWPAMLVLSAAVLFALVDGWRTTRAEVASMVARWINARQPDESLRMVELAIHIAPHEQFYRRQLVFDILGQVVGYLGAAPLDAQRFAEANRKLASAEASARAALALAERDPWAILALANVLQVRALGILRPYDAASSVRAEAGAEGLFATAHELFPAQPLVLRNWAQLRFGAGRLQDAYAMLDRMEALLPYAQEAYIERLEMAKSAKDDVEVVATLDRARQKLSSDQMRLLYSVAH